MPRYSLPSDAPRAPRAGRRALRRLVAGLGALAAAATIGAASSVADPRPTNPPQSGSGSQLSARIHSVNAQLDRLDRQMAQSDEQYNVAAAAVAASQRTATRAEQAAQGAAGRYRAAHARFVDVMRQQYENGPAATVGTLLTSGTPQQYLDGLALDSYLSDRVGQTMQDEQATRAEAARTARRAGAALAAARTKQHALGKRRAALQRTSQHFEQLLASLTEQQRRERAQARAVAAAKARAALAAARPPVARGTGQSSVTAPTPVPVNVSGSVQRVIAFAEAQVGKSYSWGAAGPNSFDCSGLTMAAWRQAGVQLPHSAAGQYGYGRHVPYSQLQPGDLIFLYSPIGHVELYVGHDLAVSAADPSIGIVYVHPSRDMADFAGATRLTG